MDCIQATGMLDSLNGICQNLNYRITSLKELTIESKKLRLFAKNYARKVYDTKINKKIQLKKLANIKSVETEISKSFGNFENHYIYIKDHILFDNAALNFISDFSTSPIIFRYKNNPEIVIKCMDFIVNFIKLTMILNTDLDIIPGVFVHIIAHQLINNNEVQEYDDIIKYLKQNEFPTSRLQSDFQNMYGHIAILLSESHNILFKWESIEQFKFVEVFSPDYFTKNYEEALKCCVELQLYSKIEEWVFFGYLIANKDLEKDQAMDLLKITIKNNPTFDIGNNLRVRSKLIYSSMTECVMPLKSSTLKSRLKEIDNVDDKSYFQNCQEKLTIISRMVRKQVVTLNELPHYNSIYFEISLTALSILKKELMRCLNIISIDYKEGVNALEKSFFKGIDTLVSLKMTLLKYSKLIKSYFEDQLVNNTISQLKEFTEKIKNIPIYHKFPEFFPSVEFFIANCNKENIQQNKKELMERATLTNNIMAHIINQEEQNKLIKRKSFFSNDEELNYSKKLSSLFMSAWSFMRRRFCFKEIVEETSGTTDIGLDPIFKLMFNKCLLMEENNYFKYCPSFLFVNATLVDQPPEILKEKALITLNMCELLSKHVSKTITKYIKSIFQLQLNEKESNNNMHKTTMFYQNRLSAVSEGINAFPVIKIHSIKIYPINIIRDIISYLISEFLKKFPTGKNEVDSLAKSPINCHGSIIILSNIISVINVTSQFQIDKYLKSNLYDLFYDSTDSGLNKKYIKLMMSQLLNPETVYSKNRDEFFIQSTETNEFSRSERLIVDNKSIYVYCYFVGLTGIKTVANFIFNKFNEFFASFIKNLENLKKEVTNQRHESTSEKMINKKLNTKHISNLFKDGVCIGKMIIFSKKIEKYFKVAFNEKQPFLYDIFKMTERENESELSSKYIFSLEYIMLQIVKSSDFISFEQNFATALYFIYSEEVMRSVYLHKEGVFSGNINVFLDFILYMTSYTKNPNDVHKKITRNIAWALAEMYEKWAANDQNYSKLPFPRLFNLVSYVFDTSKFFSKNDTASSFLTESILTEE